MYLGGKNKVALQIDPIETLNFTTDSTLLIASELQERGYKLFCYSPQDLLLDCGKLYAIGDYIELDCGGETFTKYGWQKLLLEDFQIILIRQNPPFNQQYLTTTYILETLQKPLIINNPRAIRNVSEKLSIMNFQRLIPNTIVTENIGEIISFSHEHKTVIVKSLYNYGGEGVFKLEYVDENFQVTIKQLLKTYGYLMVQEYLPEIVSSGDKRVMLMDGEIIGAISRIPPSEEFRANMVLGGKGYPTTLTKTEKDICNAVGGFLKEENIFLAGIDLISEKLIEINVTSPTGLVVMNKLYNRTLEKIIVDKIENKLKR
ncbi:glutathione synthase [Candidatus Bandiella euplotis]|uniref:Glutathione synthetase n=1 Tax=Candidatus Bandiella euplotis TaxID=1664265 RepID=A0ABZ0UM29_9RICK|nr:glutathione synthase [Candidatus Bandiella woodruffii]WPX96108.1 Glutathione synthetase [Candidatus Bandiella woodruffii]